MSAVFRVFVLLLLIGGGVPRSQTAQSRLPEFVDDPVPGINEDLAAPRQKLIYFRNLTTMKEILKQDPILVREEMLKRLSPAQPMSLRLLAATVLIFKNDVDGQKFFIAQSKISKDLGELYVTFDHLVWTAKWLPEPKVDLSWAEDMMIEAVQNRTRINRRDAMQLPRNIRFDETIEIRELAIYYGLLSSTINYLGQYKDERVTPLVLEMLTNYRASKPKGAYSSAVVAAVDMGLKNVVPILLRHLNDEDSYYGLVTLGDARVVPAIKAALPRLRSYARAEAELAIIRLQGGDVLPPLVRLLKRTDFLQRDDVVMWLEELKDPRSVPTMTSMLCYDPHWFIRSSAIGVLAAVKNKEAIQGLINGLGCDYSKLDRGKTAPDHDFNAEYRGEIAKALHEITGENFGTDQKRWTAWLQSK